VAVASGPTERAAAAALEAVADVALLEGDLPTSLDAYEAVTALATPTDLAELAGAPANQAPARRDDDPFAGRGGRAAH
jgi:hypothetical protein